jgi:hypothetical protein
MFGSARISVEKYKRDLQKTFLHFTFGRNRRLGSCNRLFKLSSEDFLLRGLHYSLECELLTYMRRYQIQILSCFFILYFYQRFARIKIF